MLKPVNHIKREVRRARRVSASIRVQDRAIAECHVMDISRNGAKLIAGTSSLVPDRFQLAFAEGDQTRSCEVLWRRQDLWNQIRSVRRAVQARPKGRSYFNDVIGKNSGVAHCGSIAP